MHQISQHLPRAQRRIAYLLISIVLSFLLVTGLYMMLTPGTIIAVSTIHYVTTTGNCGGSEPCYDTIQAAVDAASDEDEIRVATGIYTDVHDTDLGSVMVYVTKTITIAGGYTSTDWSESDSVPNPTVLDAQGQGLVLYISRPGKPVIKNLILTGGLADYTSGAIIYYSDATLDNNVIVDNTANAQDSHVPGGGLSVYNSAPTLTHNLITSNTNSYNCGGIFLHESNATLDSNIIAYNVTNGTGGGVCIQQGSDNLYNNIIANNSAEQLGSGIFVSGAPRLLHNTIANNLGGIEAGVYVRSSLGDAHLTNTIIYSQSIGIYVSEFSTATMQNTLWYGNTSNWDGSGTVLHQDDVTGDPAFVGNGDYHLGSDSAAINTGITTDVDNDIDGDPRPAGPAPDIGADEYIADEPIVFLPTVMK